MSSPVAAEWLAGVGTLVLAFVAVFQEWLRRLVVRPRLKLNARVRRPDSEKTKGNEITPAYYFRLAVTNEGNAEARDVQLYLAAVERVGLDKQPRPVEQFTPMNLQWAYMKGSPTVPVLLPKMPPKLCDLAHILIPTERQRWPGENLPGVDPSVALLLLDVEIKPNTLGYILQSGTYLFKLKLAASNHPPRDYTLEVKFEGKWFDDESKMFSDGFGMRLL